MPALPVHTTTYTISSKTFSITETVETNNDNRIKQTEVTTILDTASSRGQMIDPMREWGDRARCVLTVTVFNIINSSSVYLIIPPLMYVVNGCV